MSLELKKVSQAVSVLHQLVEKKKEGKQESRSLLGDDQEDIYLHIGLKKIPSLRHLQVHKMKIPHPLLLDTKDICLITSDKDKKKPDDDESIAHFTGLLRSAGLSVGQIIPYHQLRTEYKTFEARRLLARSYQTFLNDGRLSHLMPVALGTYFVRKKKMPFSVSLTPDKIKQEFLRATTKTTLTLTGRGSSCTVKVGGMRQSVEEVCQNVSAVASHLEGCLPGGWANVLSLHVKTRLSMAVPLYVSTGSANEVEMPSEQPSNEPVVDELSTLTHSKVKIFPSGKVTLVRAEAEDVSNENVAFEKKTLANQRYRRNKKKQRIEKKFARMLVSQAKGKGPGTRNRGKGAKVGGKSQEVPAAKSPFGSNRKREDPSEGLLRKRKKYPNRDLLQTGEDLDKSFEDSFSVRQHKLERAKQETKTVGRYELKQIQLQETAEPEPSRGHGSRLKLRSKKRSYSMMTKSQSNAENVNTELLSFSKKDFTDVSEKSEEKVKQEKLSAKRKARAEETGKGNSKGSKKSEIKTETKPNKKLSRLQSIRHSVRLAKGLM